ncbi:hypothetical protein Tco_0422513 [Tanacetum coccineum]
MPSGHILKRYANHGILSSSDEETFIRVSSGKLSSISSSFISSSYGFSSRDKWYAVYQTHRGTIFDGVNDTGIEKFDNLPFHDFFHIWVKSTLPLNNRMETRHFFSLSWSREDMTTGRRKSFFQKSIFQMLEKRKMALGISKQCIKFFFRYFVYDIHPETCVIIGIRMSHSFVNEECDSIISYSYIEFFVFHLDDSITGFKVFPESEAYSEYGIRLMLAPRSAKVRYSTDRAMVHGIKKLIRSPSLGGSLF